MEQSNNMVEFAVKLDNGQIEQVARHGYAEGYKDACIMFHDYISKLDEYIINASHAVQEQLIK